MNTVDNNVYEPRPLRDFDVGVIKPVRAFAEKLEARDGRNKDIEIAYSFMHYICFDDVIAAQAERPVYDCLISVCPRAEDNMPSECEGLHTGDI